MVGALQNLESDLRYESCNGIPPTKRSSRDGTTNLFDIQVYIDTFRKKNDEQRITAFESYEIMYKVDMVRIMIYYTYRRMYIE